jgi:hypothetical protein
VQGSRRLVCKGYHNKSAYAFDSNYTVFNPAPSFAFANATANVDPFGVKGNFTSAGSVANTGIINGRACPFVNATEATFSISATTTAPNGFSVKTSTTGSLSLDGTNTANNAAYAMTTGNSFAQGTNRAIDFSTGISNTQVADNGVLSGASAFSTSNAETVEVVKITEKHRLSR